MEEDGGITLSTLSGESSAYLQQMLHLSHTMKEKASCRVYAVF